MCALLFLTHHNCVNVVGSIDRSIGWCHVGIASGAGVDAGQDQKPSISSCSARASLPHLTLIGLNIVLMGFIFLIIIDSFRQFDCFEGRYQNQELWCTIKATLPVPASP